MVKLTRRLNEISVHLIESIPEHVSCYVREQNPSKEWTMQKWIAWRGYWQNNHHGLCLHEGGNSLTSHGRLLTYSAAETSLIDASRICPAVQNTVCLLRTLAATCKQKSSVVCLGLRLGFSNNVNLVFLEIFVHRWSKWAQLTHCMLYLFVWLIDDDWPDNFKCLPEKLTYLLTPWLTDWLTVSLKD